MWRTAPWPLLLASLLAAGPGDALAQPAPAPPEAAPPPTPVETTPAPPDPVPAPPDPTPEPDPVEPLPDSAEPVVAEPIDEAAVAGGLAAIQVHGFVSQGAYMSTANNLFGHSERGSVELTEAAINVTSEVADRLRVGIQLFTRDLGPIGDYKIALDWAFIDYRWKQWLGMRAGRIKMPFGLYNEVNDVPAGRLPILLPQSVYPITSRDFLLSLTGFSIYGSPQVGDGRIDYQLFAGTIFLDAGDAPGIVVDSRRAAGVQAFWRPIEGLRLGPTWLNARIDFDVQLDPAQPVTQFNIHDANLLVGSAEYATGPWLFAAEYSRWIIDSEIRPEGVFPDSDSDSERFYAMVTRRMSESFEVGGYCAVRFVDVDDREGEGDAFTIRHKAYQEDVAATLRYDVNEYWLVKVEGHYMRGTADLSAADNPDPGLEKNWGLFLGQTALTF